MTGGKEQRRSIFYMVNFLMDKLDLHFSCVC
jgi:hypothetical protein